MIIDFYTQKEIVAEVKTERDIHRENAREVMDIEQGYVDAGLPRDAARVYALSYMAFYDYVSDHLGWY